VSCEKKKKKKKRQFTIPRPIIRHYGQPQGRREAYDLAVVCYPSLSIDLLYDFKKVQPMPNHPAIFSSLPLKQKKNPSPPLSFPFFVLSRLFPADNSARDT